MDSVKSRTLAFIAKKGLKMKEFEDMAQLSTGYVTSMRKGYGSEKLNNVLAAFPDLNRDWLLYGEGKMLKPSEGDTSSPSESITSNQRLKEVQKILNFRTQQEFADALGIKQGSLSDIYRGKVGVSSAILLTLSKDYSINIKWLKTGEGSMLKEEPASEATEKPVIVWTENERAPGIPIYDVDFACSFVEMYNDFSSSPIGWLSLPPFNDPERYAVVRAVGDSMSPDIEHGALIILGRQPLPVDRVFYGDIYGIETIDDMRSIKRIVRAEDKHKVRLVPSNPAYGDYQDYPTEAIRRVYKVFHVFNQKSY